MAGRGRPAKTREQKLLSKTFRLDRDKPTIQGSIITELPSSPVPLSEIAYQYYSGVGRQLINIGILNETDLTDLETFAYSYGEFWRLDSEQKVIDQERRELDILVKEARDNRDKEEYRILSDDYARKTRDSKQCAQQKREFLNTALKLSARLGLNPIDRQKLSIAPPTEEIDPFAEE
jgi:phage terminase small subunit